jgi:hypothetical protein
MLHLLKVVPTSNAIITEPATPFTDELGNGTWEHTFDNDAQCNEAIDLIMCLGPLLPVVVRNIYKDGVCIFGLSSEVGKLDPSLVSHV